MINGKSGRGTTIFWNGMHGDVYRSPGKEKIMSNDLVRRWDVFVYLTEYYNHRTELQHDCLKQALSRVPSAEPERKKGRWIHKGCGCFECDQCGERVSINVYIAEKASDRFKFCPNCGADMRKEEMGE